jgi:hypothetical protein
MRRMRLLLQHKKLVAISGSVMLLLVKQPM